MAVIIKTRTQKRICIYLQDNIQLMNTCIETCSKARIAECDWEGKQLLFKQRLQYLKKLSVACALLLFVSDAFCGVRVKLTISKPFGIINFIRAGSKDAHISKTLVAYVKDNISPADSAKFYEAVRGFASIGLDNSYTFDEYPISRQKPKTMAGIINNAAIQSGTIDEFLGRIVGILPNEQWMRLKKSLLAAEPFYDEMMRRMQAPMSAQLQALEKYTRQTDKVFYTLKTFYGSTWSDEMPFTVSLFAIPGRKGNTTAAPYSNSLALGVLTEEVAHEMRMGVAIHEIGHVLYEEQPLKLQWKIDSAFNQSKSKYARYAYGYFDEALATACGNGWAAAQLSGNIDTGSWYDDDYINKYAKSIYPLVKKYIEGGKSIDCSFVTKCIRRFEQTFPDAIYEYANLLNSVNLYTDAETHTEFNEIFNSLSRHVRITSSNSSYPIADANSLEQMDKSPGTQLFIIHTHHKENWALLKEKFPQIKELNANDEGIASFFDNSGRPIVLVNVKGTQRVEQGILLLEKNGRMNPRQLFSPLK
jgi:hypothetical protein